MSQIYLDCDGVLADFDRSATIILGMPPGDFEELEGSAEFWRRLTEAPDFYANLEPMVDALELFEGVRAKSPIILTGVPRGEWAAGQKVRWAAKHFPGVPIITCMAANKHCYRKPGDVLVDDRDKYRDRWEKGGGLFVHHTSAGTSLEELRLLGFL